MKHPPKSGPGPKYKYGEPTKVMRIPLSMVGKVLKLLASKKQ